MLKTKMKQTKYQFSPILNCVIKSFDDGFDFVLSVDYDLIPGTLNFFTISKIDMKPEFSIVIVYA